MMASKFKWIAAFCFWSCLGAAQIQISPLSAPDGTIAPERLWQVQLTNLTGAGAQVILLTEISRSGQLVYRRQSRPIRLTMGQQSLNENLVQEQQERFYDQSLQETVHRTGLFPAGTYQVCLIVKSPGGGGELGRNCRQLIQQPWDKTAGQTTKGWQWGGRGNIEYFYTDQSFWGATGPRQYVQFDLHPRVQIQDIPLGLDVFYTSADQAWTPGMNALSLSFDAQRFQEQVREKLRSKLEEKTGRIQEEFALDFAREEQLIKELQGLSDSSQLQYQQLIPQLKKRLKQYPEKELRYRERQLRQRLEAEQQDYIRKKKIQLQDSSTARVDSLNNTFQKLEVKQNKTRQQLSDLQQKISELEKLKRELAGAQQGLQRYRSLEGRSGFLNAQLQELKEQNDSLRQILSQPADLSAPNVLKHQLQQNGMFKKQYSWLLAIRELKLGTYRPHYSPLILNGSQANGFALRVSPQPNWQFSASVGKIQSPFWNLNGVPSDAAPLPLVAAGKVAWQGPGIQPYIMVAAPFKQSHTEAIESTDPPTSSTLKVGAGLDFDLFQHKLTAQIDGAWAPNTAGSTTISFGQMSAIHFNSQWLFSEQTRFSATWQSVGTDYEAIGSPFLLPGMEQIDLQLEQGLWENQLTAGVFYLKDNNRPIGFSPFTFQNHQYGVQLRWQAEALPQIMTRLGRNLLSNENTDSHSWLWNFLATYPYRIGNLQLSTQFSFQHTQQQLDDQLPPQFYSFLEARQQLFWNDRFSTTLAAYRNITALSASNQDLKGVDLQLALNSQKYTINLTGGLYQQNTPATDYRIHLHIRFPISKRLQYYINGGRQPSLINASTYYFIRTGFTGTF